MKDEINIGMHFKIISNQIKRVIDNKLNNNITNVQMFILKYIADNQGKKDIFQKDIETFLDIRRSTTTEILNVMERKDLIKRIDFQKDKRKKVLKLSSKGLSYINEFEEIVSKIEQNLLNNITKEEKEHFFYIINKIQKNIDNIQEEIW